MRAAVADRRFAPGWLWLPVTGVSGSVSQDQVRAAATDRGVDWATAPSPPFGLDCVDATNLAALLRDWAGLTEVHIRDTGRASAMQGMFASCSSLMSAPELDTSSARSMDSMFSNCSSLTSVPDMDTSSVELMSVMFRGCSSLASVPAFDTWSVTTMREMFRGCSSLLSIPGFDTSSVTRMDQMFYGCSSLTSIPALDVGQVTNMEDMFYGCSSLEWIDMYGATVSFSVSGTELGASALDHLFENLGTAAPGATISVWDTPGDFHCDRSVAEAKGWTVS